MTQTPIVELGTLSAFSFLQGASLPEELIAQAAHLGFETISLADWHGISGVVRAHRAAKECGIRLIPGTRFTLSDGSVLLAYPIDRTGWGWLCKLLTLGHHRGERGVFALDWSDLKQAADHLVLILQPGIATVMTGDVRLHDAKRHLLLNVLTAIHTNTTLDALGPERMACPDLVVRGPDEQRTLFAAFSEALTNQSRIADLCRFSLDDLRDQYPSEATIEGESPQENLARLVQGAPPLSGRHTGDGPRAGQTRAHPERAAGLCALFPDGEHDRPARPLAGHCLSGPWLGRQLGDLLCAADHQHRSCPLRPAFRAVRLRRSQGTARYRCRFRKRSSRRDYSVNLQPLRSA